MNNLTRLINLIDEKIANAGDRQTMTSAQTRHAGHAILRELAASEGASFQDSGSDYSLRLAGVRSTCTHGHFGLLGNWKASARRQISQSEQTPEEMGL
ncbi:hypothetical protein [Pararhizobium sp.]|uniref:hypothetical protein n=1 Tax=Pararhizobium sp. TaxID=1977563 RepID=UPI003D0991E6